MGMDFPLEPKILESILRSKHIRTKTPLFALMHMLPEMLLNHFYSSGKYSSMALCPPKIFRDCFRNYVFGLKFVDVSASDNKTEYKHPLGRKIKQNIYVSPK